MYRSVRGRAATIDDVGHSAATLGVRVFRIMVAFPVNSERDRSGPFGLQDCRTASSEAVHVSKDDGGRVSEQEARFGLGRRRGWNEGGGGERR